MSDGPGTTFFKMPKTGSSSVEYLLEGQENVAIVQHDSPATAREALQVSDWSFSFVRNPFWRLVSAWNWVVHAPTRVDELHEQAHREFSKFRDFADLAANLDSVCHAPCAIHFLPMCDWICAGDGLLVDRVCRYEDFEQEIRDLCRERGLESVDFSRLQRRVFLGVSQQSTYAGLYDSEQVVEQVAQFYAEDFSRFAYSQRLPGA